MAAIKAIFDAMGCFLAGFGPCGQWSEPFAVWFFCDGLPVGQGGKNRCLCGENSLLCNVACLCPDSVLTEAKNIQSLILAAVEKRALFTQYALPSD
ncbi:MAG TPA: hypothetical protein PKW76_17020 [bacterium]|nr:hypothetical protein [bacterium]HPG47373.1 hypothetical protein [bacterium]HPM99725.1 hypothetical protein [bacterium]